MSKFTWRLLALLFTATTMISQWHLDTEREMHAQEIEGWEVITDVLCDHIDERDEYIDALEELLNDLIPPRQYESN